MPFFLKHSVVGTPVVDKAFKSNGVPCIIDGVDIINTLCPVSKATGLRENPLSLIRKLVNDPAKQVLLMSIIQELPTDNSQQNLDEESKFEFCAQRLNVGTPAENEVLMQHLEKVIDLMADSEKAAKASEVVDKIAFDAPDKEVIDNV